MNNIKERIKRFIGKSSQIPPIYSAIKIKGKKAYEYARNGENVSLKPREIEIFNIGLFGVNIVFKKLHYNLEENYLSKKYLIRDIFIFLAGPLSNLVLAIIFKNIKVVYDINIFLCILNLIPVYPLDGYNIFKNLLLLKLDERNSDKIINIISYIVFLILFICGILIFILLYNPSFVLFLLYLVILKFSYKNSKKHTKYYN